MEEGPEGTKRGYREPENRVVLSYREFPKFGVQFRVGSKNQTGDREVITLVLFQSQLSFYITSKQIIDV